MVAGARAVGGREAGATVARGGGGGVGGRGEGGGGEEMAAGEGHGVGALADAAAKVVASVAEVDAAKMSEGEETVVRGAVSRGAMEAFGRAAVVESAVATWMLAVVSDL